MRGKTTEDRIVDTVNYILLTIIGIAAFYPFYYLLIISFNEGMDTIFGPEALRLVTTLIFLMILSGFRRY
jgi:ABC-type glycerol-3-phosphate transport system permease component